MYRPISYFAEHSRILSIALGMIPLPLPDPAPCMVWVLPAPVWPYEKRHTLKPSRADWTSSLTSLKMESCLVFKEMF